MLRRGRRGAYAVEFALVLPVLVAFAAGMTDWGWYFAREYEVQAAAKVCARTGASTDRDDNPVGAAQTAGQASLTEAGRDPTLGTVVATRSGSTPGERITCTVSQPLAPLIGLVPTMSAMRASVTMRMEDQQ
jgi:Flp pilus assembly protein TadG